MNTELCKFNIYVYNNISEMEIIILNTSLFLVHYQIYKLRFTFITIIMFIFL